MRIHPVFHNSLLKPYKETREHGPNFKRPPPEIVAGEEGHYEIERILKDRPTRNRKSTEYLVKWKDYPEAENSWIPQKELSHAQELLANYKKSKTRIRTLQEQRGLKEGILLWAQPMTTHLQRCPPSREPTCDEPSSSNPGKDTYTSRV